jgi:hypothetical protein
MKFSGEGNREELSTLSTCKTSNKATTQAASKTNPERILWYTFIVPFLPNSSNWLSRWGGE